MGCRDKSVTFLQSIGYNLVRYPRADLAPLELLATSGNELERFGSLGTVFDSEHPLPVVTSDAQASNVTGIESSSLKAGLGLTVLGSLIEAMGGSRVGLDLKYSRADRIEFKYSDVTENHIELASLDQYLASSDIAPNSPTASRLLEDDGAYVVSSTLKSNRIEVRATDKSGSEIGLDLPVIEEVVGAKVSVSLGKDNSKTLVYIGKAQLVFGVKAVRLFFEDGEFRCLKPASNSVVVKGFGPGGSGDEPELLTSVVSSSLSRFRN
jgi:hypothetical protein